MRTLLIISAFFLCNSLYAQNYWAQKQAGGNVDETLACASDASGNSYLTGYFSTSANINGTPKSVNGLTDIFITKTTQAGNSTWVKSFGGSGSDRGLDIAVDESGNVYVCGFYKSTISFGGGVSITSNGNSQDGFLAKFDGSGNIVWAKSFGSSGQVDQANGIAVDGSGSVFVTGQFAGDAEFDGLTLSSLGGSTDVCTVKYNASGDVQWAKKGSGDTLDKGTAVSTDDQGNVYVTGQFSGDITFDNSYSNSIQNALFLIKYNSAGEELWFRWAGGTDQAISYDIEVVGSSVFFVGDFGSQITFFGGSGTPNIASSFSNAVFLASYSTSGSFAFGESMGSESAVSARGLDVKNGEIAIAGWFECTFNELSEEYGEVTFNNLGFRDVFVMRYTSTGSFQWARNIGSKQSEMAYDVAILNDNIEVVVGVFHKKMIVPVSSGMNISGSSQITYAPNYELTYCGDSDYGDFAYINGEDDPQNGFAFKVINPDRLPLDFYQHYGSGCELDIPETCIQIFGEAYNEVCVDMLTLCPGEEIMAVNQIFPNSDVGYNYSVNWSPSGSGVYTVNQEGTVTATITSEDGCYTSTASIDIELHPEPDNPLISDNLGINTMAEVPFPIIICPGETVDLTGFTDPNNIHIWGGPGVSNDESENLTITVDMAGWYTFSVVNEFGCIESNFVQVIVDNVVPDLIDPYITNAFGDTLNICSNANASFSVYDIAFNGIVPPQGYDFSWSVTPGGFSSSGNSVVIPGGQEGWFYISVEIEKEENDCESTFPIYNLTDSVFIQVLQAPSVFIDITGPSVVCTGDTVTLFLDYDGELSFGFTPIANFQDSVWVDGPGYYTASVNEVSDNGCSAQASTSITISEVDPPTIVSSSETGIVCPGDSVLIVSYAQGDVTWLGPDGPFIADTNFVYVSESGVYYTEVSYYEGCELVSNTVEISEYTTPYISGSNAVICDGDSVEISIISSSDSNINWLPPLSGNNPIQMINEPGTYQAEIMACGITTLATIEVDTSTYILEIMQADLTPVCAGDSILVEASPNYAEYQWNPSAGNDSTGYFHTNGTVQAIATDPLGCEQISNVINISFEPLPPMPSFDFDLVCEGDTQIVTVESDYDISFVDESTGTVLQTGGVAVLPNFIADTTLYVYLSSEYCDGPIGSLDIGPIIYPDQPLLSSNAPACTGTFLNLIVDNSVSGVVYTWTSPDLETNQGANISIYIEDLNQAGLYSCFADLTGCASDTAVIAIDLFETVEVELPADTGICNTSEMIISTNENFAEYIWQDGTQDSIYVPQNTGLISVLTYDFNGCISSDEMYIDLFDCDYDIPNVFSPNGDGFNDYWDFGIGDPLYYELIVFNRWGLKVFESSENQILWNGNNYNNDKPCPEGVYYYILRFVNIDLYRYEVSGYVTILR